MNNNLAIMERFDTLEDKIDDKLGDRWLSTNEASQYSGLSYKTIHRAIRSGSLKVSQTTGKNLFRKSWLDRWIEGR